MPNSEIPKDEGLIKQLSDIQANLIKGIRWEHARYHFLTIEEPEIFRNAFATALGTFPLASAEAVRHKQRPECVMNVAFTHYGLKALGVHPDFLDSFPKTFREGMAARASQLGDTEESAPENWDRWLGTRGVHVLFALFGNDENRIDTRWRKFVETGEGTDGGGSNGTAAVPSLAGSRLLATENGHQITDDQGGPIEHFGFRDGISQPALADGFTSPEGGGWRDREGDWKPIETGEFLLGHRDMDGFNQLDAVPALRALCYNGTYLVFRKLRQHVDRFDAFLKANSTNEPEREFLAARMVGRWKNGNSLVRHPDGPGSAESEMTPNDFGYHDEDADGKKCPFASHVRRINPRDEHPERTLDPKSVARHRIIRRGFPYTDASEGSDVEKGLLFVCFNARIDSQFEFLQEEWINRGDFFGNFSTDKDPLVGANDESSDALSLPNRPCRIPNLPRFVTTRGGDYFFMPGIHALSGLLDGHYAGSKVAALPAAKPAGPYDPVLYPAHLDLPHLFHTRNLDAITIEGRALDGSARTQSWYYVVGYDQVQEVLGDEGHFTVEHNTRRIYELLRDPDPGQQDFELQMLLGLPGGHPEKTRRHQMLRAAMGATAGSVADAFLAVEQNLENLAFNVTSQLISTRGQQLDISKLARVIPIQRIQNYYGIPLPQRISDLHRALHFRQLLERDREWLTRAREVLCAEGKGRAPGLVAGIPFEFLDWDDQFPSVPGAQVGTKEMGFLCSIAAIELLIDIYNTGELFDMGKLAMRELRRHIRESVDHAQAAGADPDPRTLMAAFLKHAPTSGPDRDDYLKRVWLLLLELVVGGVETPAKAITNTVNSLLTYPGAMAAAQSAVDNDDRQSLDLLIYEALRLDPVAFLLYRECPDGAILETANKTAIAPGSMVALFLKAAYQDRRFFKDPSEFQPNRAPKIDDPSLGREPHECVGRHIAIAEVRGVLRALLGKYDLQRVAGEAGQRRERFRFPIGLSVKLYPRS
jgi:Dyp-type peroxidase family